jgi:hypothetical protein
MRKFLLPIPHSSRTLPPVRQTHIELDFEDAGDRRERTLQELEVAAGDAWRWGEIEATGALRVVAESLVDTD